MADKTCSESLTPRYKCFLSYRHSDNKREGRQWATWLHHVIETYEVPADLVGTRNTRGEEIPARIFPVFRDEEELPADTDLSAPIIRALENSLHLLVLCSPGASSSRFVADEIVRFKALGKSNRVFAAIIAGEPNVATDAEKQASGLAPECECFPRPLRYEVDTDGRVSDRPAEPVAADFRLGNGQEGWTSPEAYRNALKLAGTASEEIARKVDAYDKRLSLMKLKVIAGILGVPLGMLTQRDRVYQLELANRRARALRRWLAVMGLLLILALAGGLVAAHARQIATKERSRAEQALVVAKAQEQEAIKQAAISKAVSAFQSEMLSAADPTRMLGDTVTVLQATQEALRRLDAGSLKEQPLVEAAVRAVIGKTFISLGRYDEAELVLTRSLDIRRHSLPAMHLDIALNLGDLGDALTAQGKYADAEVLYREALGIERKSLPSADAKLAPCLNNLANLLVARNHSTDAEPLFREAIQIGRGAGPAGTEALLDSLNGLSMTLAEQRKASEAEMVRREALEVARRSLPAGHPLLATILKTLADTLQQRGNQSEAEPLYQESLAIARKALPAGHPDIAYILVAYGQSLVKQGKLAEAEPLFREGVAIQRKALPAGHPEIDVTLTSFGELLGKQGKLAEAESMYREVVENSRKAVANKADMRRLAISLGNLAMHLHAVGKQDGRESLYREAVEILRKSDTEAHYDSYLAWYLDNLGIVLRYDKNTPAEAEVLYPEALAAARKAGDLQWIHRCLEHYAELKAVKSLAEAEPLLREELLLRGLPAEHLDVVDYLVLLGDANLHRDSASVAEPMFRQALEVYSKEAPGDELRMASATSGLGEALLRMGRFAESQPQLGSALETYTRKSGLKGEQTLAVARILAELFRQTGQTAEAAELQRKYGLDAPNGPITWPSGSQYYQLVLDQKAKRKGSN